MLREAPNVAFQFLLADSVRLLREELRQHKIEIGECISLDTKHIWPGSKRTTKTYVEGRYDKPSSPWRPDCKLGCKRRHNKRSSLGRTPPTPRTTHNQGKLQVGDFYWGYGSGVVVTKCLVGRINLAELTAL
jgi:hypothetical protein